MDVIDRVTVALMKERGISSTPTVKKSWRRVVEQMVFAAKKAGIRVSFETDELTLPEQTELAKAFSDE